MWPIENQPTNATERARVFQARGERAARLWRLPPKGYSENDGLLRAVIDSPDANEPRRAYAAWMLAQDDDDARSIGELVNSQLRVAEEYRASPRGNSVTAAELKSYGGRGSYRSWPAKHVYDLDLLILEGLVGFPEMYRGFVEHVAVRGERFLEIADELFSLAPIRHLSLIGIPAVVDELAASPHLARMRSLSLPEHGPADQLTDDVLARFLASPHLTNVVHLRLGGDHKLTPRAYEHVVTTPTLPRLSNFEVYFDGTATCWAEPINPNFDSSQLSYFERVIDQKTRSYDLRETPIPVVLRPEDWIVELERKLGYVPCVHPEEHYGGYIVDIEAVVSHPIALDPDVMARRGQPVADPGPKPSLMERREQGLCALCGSDAFAYEPGDPDLYSDPMGLSGIFVCRRCGTRWFADQWPEKQQR